MDFSSIHKHYIKKSSIAAIALMAMTCPIACHDAKAGKDNSSDTELEARPDEELSRLMKSISEGDAKTFASICVYPVKRPYPLKDIADSTAMADYFPVMIDDSLRSAMQDATLDDWESYGWRGWSMSKGTPIWYDEGVQYVTYLSPAERGLRRLLAREEIQSLSPEYRDGWEPVMTLLSADRKKLFRIDSKGDQMRLMAFDAPFRGNEKPAMMMMGKMTQEGSGDYTVYGFNDADGLAAEYAPDAEPPVKIIFTSPSAPEDGVEVYPAYWRDEVRY